MSFAAVLLALLATAAGLALSVHYPLMPPLMGGVFMVCGALFFAWPASWLVAVPALLPVIGLAPWTGWITLEELDLLVLAAAAGGYARLAWRPVDASAQTMPARAGRPNALVWFVVALFALSTLIAMGRGIADAGGFSFGWFQGYHEPMNSLRLAKPLFLALLLLPLWRSAAEHAPEAAASRLVLGLMLGLAGASLAATWERAAFTDILNFSADYRTTALFWEMHVGGAALDGFLAMTVPFAIYTLVTDRVPARWAVAAAIAAVGAYASLTTFSRGVYLAVPIGVGLMLGLQAVNRRRTAQANPHGPSSTDDGGLAHAIFPALLLLAAFSAGTAWMFPSSGYRGMLALMGAMALVLMAPPMLQRFRIGDWLGGLLLGAVFAAAAMVGAWLIPKGAYLVYTFAIAATAVAFYEVRRRMAAKKRRGMVAPLALAGFLAVVTGVALVAHHWGGSQGLADALPVVAGVLFFAALAAKPGKPAWPGDLRWLGMVFGTMAMVAGIVGVFGGGAYMTGRFSTGGKDFDGRIEHWRQGLAALLTPGDWALGKGLGRFPSTYFFSPTTAEHPGDYRLVSGDRNSHLTMSAGQHTTGWGEILRMSQRIDTPVAPVKVTADVRADGPISLHFEVCEKHLLYNAGCLIRQVSAKPQPGEWQRVQVELEGKGVGHGDWYAPKLLMFSMAMYTRSGRADIDNVTLTDAHGRQLLANGDFADGMARWFFSSDRHHMPWHIKSVFMNVLFDQGVAGLVLWLSLCAGAMWRVCLGRAREHPLAPPLAGALAGFLVVGLFDSLLDVPRVAFVFYFLLLLALTIRTPRAGHSGGSGSANGHKAKSAPAVLLAAVVAIGLATLGDSAQAGGMLRVGPGRAVKTIAQAASLAQPGDTIEVDAGEYIADVAVWTKDNLTLRAVGGRVRLLAQGAAAEGKGIWVIRAANFDVQGFDFEGASVPSRNGAGIRFDKGSLRVRDCSFRYNEMGLLTGNDPESVLEVENSEFAYNSRPDGHNHNLYVGQIARLSVQGSYIHHARTGHLLKSRAALNHILYNRLTDETGGSASYELEFPNGGVAYVIGNIIEQGALTENPNVISFGAEGYKWPANAIYLVNNTLIDNRASGGAFLRVMPGAQAVQASNNLLVGNGVFDRNGSSRPDSNFEASRDEFESLAQADYRLKRGSRLAGKAVDPGQANGQSLQPKREYVHPRSTRELNSTAHNPGAVQRMARPPG
ncbi:MAG TPA: hypothetical protein VLJ57_03930 [Burkholderiaceae bacterium]|nr:hypothetical protein [Burkholderiaceae bacterium]